MESAQLIQKVRETLLDHRMIEPGDLVLAAVSGGADSCALLHVLHRLSAPMGFGLHVAHFNHELRGAESAGDEEFVARLAASLALPLTTGSAGGRLARPGAEGSLEEEGRRLRYEFLEHTAVIVGSRRIATGHTLDDQAETVLMRVLQGTGPGGLSGIRPVRDGRIIRPLIRCRSSEIAAYLGGVGITPRTDSSNRDPEFLRNRIRMDLLPALETAYNPRIVEALERISAVEREVDRHMRREAGEALRACTEAGARAVSGGPAGPSSQGKMRLALDRFAGYDIGLQMYILRAAIEGVLGRLTDVSYRHMEMLLDLARRGDTPFRQVELPGSLVAYLERGALVLTAEELHREEDPQEIAVPGTTPLPGFGLEIRTSFAPSPEEVPSGTAVGSQALFDWGALCPPLVVRGWRPGDRFRPAGMQGRKKIQDFFVDEKIPRRVRHRTPLLIDQRAIHWVIGYRTSELSRVRDCTTRVLRVEAVPLTA